MVRLSIYIESKFSLTNETKLIIFSVLVFAHKHYTNIEGELTKEGVDFIQTLVGRNLKMKRQEIVDNWFAMPKYDLYPDYWPTNSAVE